ncbi:hypothetical protein BX600DRAFT_505541 [Xylariales sp. PMI_506]|nr:hypothetical protein BX600DRAFT_505541 [Xylariales sp. PMI_506]
MVYTKYEDSALPINEFRGCMEQQKRHKSCVFHALKVLTGTALILFAFFSTLLPGIISLQRLGIFGHNIAQLKFVGIPDVDRWAVAGGSLPRHFNSHAPLPDRDLGITRTTDTNKGQHMVAINPLNPDNLVYVTTCFYPLPRLQSFGGCLLAYSFDRGQTWIDITAEYPLITGGPTCGESQLFSDVDGTFYLLRNHAVSGQANSMTSRPWLFKSTDGGKTWTVPSVPPLYIQNLSTRMANPALVP